MKTLRTENHSNRFDWNGYVWRIQHQQASLTEDNRHARINSHFVDAAFDDDYHDILEHARSRHTQAHADN